MRARLLEAVRVFWVTSSLSSLICFKLLRPGGSKNIYAVGREEMLLFAKHMLDDADLVSWSLELLMFLHRCVHLHRCVCVYACWYCV